MKVYKGNIITVDKNNSIAKYLVEDEGKIVFVGDTLPEQYSSAPLEDLGEGALMPAFADTHGHFASYAMLSTTVKLDKAKTIKEILDILVQADKEIKKGKTILCFGTSSKVREGRLIEKSEIDSVLPHRTVVIICSDGHTAIFNERALAKMPKVVSETNGYDYATGILRQECFYKAVDNILKVISIMDGLQAFQGAFDEYAKNGFALICAESGSGMPRDLDVELLKWIYRGQNNGVQMRFFIQSYDVKKAQKRGIPRLGGCFKAALDGSLTSDDAALLQPYEGTTNYGRLFYTDEQLYEMLLKVHLAGLAFQMHAIGDAAVMQATRTYKRILDQYPKDDHRHGIIHATLVPDEAMDIIDKYKLQIIEQPGLLELLGENAEYMLGKLGEERGYAAEPFNEYIKRGIVVSGSSDCPVTFPNGVKWLHWLVNNLNEAHRISLTDAIRICTFNGYFNTFDEVERGSLEVGKIADMITLSRSPYNVSSEDIKDIEVTATYYGGKRWEKQNKNIIGTIFKGMFKKGIKL